MNWATGDPAHMAQAWVTLMRRLGYRKFVAQGGDWGAIVTELMGVQAAEGLLGIHTNMPGVFPAEVDGAAFSGAPTPAGLSADEKLAYERLQFVYFLDHDARSYELIARVFRGEREGLTRDDVLDNITITWFRSLRA